MLNNEWDIILSKEIESDYFNDLMQFVKQEYQGKTVYPCFEDIFKAYQLTDYNNVKVVILGQDPYHQPHQATGLAFSVNKGIKLPPSLKNIFKELKSDLAIDNQSGDLKSWAKQGIFLLNTSLTVIDSLPNSHNNIGWQRFTDNTIKVLNLKKEPVLFVLWGNFALKKKCLITNPIHQIIETSHPSPLSARHSFFNSGVFSRINEFTLENYNITINFKTE